MTSIREYYRNNLPVLPHNSHQRQFKLKLENKKWVIIRKRIRTSRQLQHFLVKHAPIDVYVSVSRWLSSEQLWKGEMRTHKWIEKNFLGSDYIIDNDSNNYMEQLEKAYEFIKDEFGGKDFIFIKTFRGGQMVWLDFEKIMIDREFNYPFDREYYYRKKMIELTDLLEVLNIKFDYKVSKDTHRIYRVGNTLHRNGVVCRAYRSFDSFRNSFSSTRSLAIINTSHWSGNPTELHAVNVSSNKATDERLGAIPRSVGWTSVAYYGD